MQNINIGSSWCADNWPTITPDQSVSITASGRNRYGQNTLLHNDEHPVTFASHAMENIGACVKIIDAVAL